MHECIKQFEQEFGVSLPLSFRPCSIYNKQLDYFEYVSVDNVTIHDRIDQYLTLVLDGKDMEVVGFRLKGFQCIYNKSVKHLLPSDLGFEALISVLSAIIATIGDNLYLTEEQKSAYRKTAEMIKEKNVGLPLAFAA